MGLQLLLQYNATEISGASIYAKLSINLIYARTPNMSRLRWNCENYVTRIECARYRA